jgi:hypothetical protein
LGQYTSDGQKGLLMTGSQTGPQPKENMATKSAKRSNGRKTNVKLRDLRANKDPHGGGTPSATKPGPGPSPDGLGRNHNEMFLADVS